MSENFIKYYEPTFNPQEHTETFTRCLELIYLSGSEFRYVNGVCWVHGDIPEACIDTYIPISEDVQVEAGDCVDLSRDSEGNPILAIYSKHNFPLSELRLRRRIILNECDWLISRHLSQPDNAKTLSPEQYAELQNYMQALRDLPASADLSNIVWPTKPSFI